MSGREPVFGQLMLQSEHEDILKREEGEKERGREGGT